LRKHQSKCDSGHYRHSKELGHSLTPKRNKYLNGAGQFHLNSYFRPAKSSGWLKNLSNYLSISAEEISAEEISAEEISAEEISAEEISAEEIFEMWLLPSMPHFVSSR
jgi:hypothetical protein